MIEHLKIKNHKGIISAALMNLGKVNVICGKNNSGKTSILESISLKEKHFVGIEITDKIKKEIISRFSANQAKQYSNPDPVLANSWFRAACTSYLVNHKYWFQDELFEISDKFKLMLSKHQYFKHYNKNLYSFVEEFEAAFKQNLSSSSINSILIPPKRNIQSKAKINLDEELQANGKGVINKLFFLKNKDLKSEEFITYQRIHLEFKNITNCSFNIVPVKENHLVLKFQVGNNWVPAEDCGLGLKDLLFIITIILCTKYSMYLIEEPESHLHPDFQTKLLNFINNIDDKQFFISTHSSTFLDSNKINRLFYCWLDESVKVSDKTSMSKIFDSLGYSITENLTSDAIILTEGPTDIPIIKRLLYLNGVLEDSNIKFWPLGGDIMGALDLSLFLNGSNVFAVIDNDPGSSRIRKKFESNCESNNIICIKLKRYSIENYLTLSIIKKVFPNQVPKTLKELDQTKSVDEQIGFKSKKKTIKGKNHIMAEQLSADDLKNTDLWEFGLIVSKRLATEM